MQPVCNNIILILHPNMVLGIVNNGYVHTLLQVLMKDEKDMYRFKPAQPFLPHHAVQCYFYKNIANAFCVATQTLRCLDSQIFMHTNPLCSC